MNVDIVLIIFSDDNEIYLRRLGNFFCFILEFINIKNRNRRNKIFRILEILILD